MLEESYNLLIRPYVRGKLNLIVISCFVWSGCFTGYTCLFANAEHSSTEKSNHACHIYLGYQINECPWQMILSFMQFLWGSPAEQMQ